jgi:hypothetical protein
VQNEIETTEGENMDLSEALGGKSSEGTSEFLPLPRIRQNKRTRRNNVLKKRLNCSQVAQTKL